MERPDFLATTSNKQLNFLQHVRTLLRVHGSAAIVCRITCCLKAGPGRQCAGGCSKNATSIPC